jgi:outer membrane autotransporter protein
MLLSGRLLIGSWQDRNGAQFASGNSDQGPDPAAWVRVIGQSDDFRGSGLGGTGPRLDQQFIALQTGFNFYDSGTREGKQDVAGVYIAAGHMNSDVQHDSVLQGWMDAGSNRFNTASLGVYGTHYGPDGWYLDGVLQATWYGSVTATPSQATEGITTGARGIAGSVEGGGIPWKLADRLKLQPVLQLIYQDININRASNDFSSVHFGQAQSLASRLGGVLTGNWMLDGNGAQHVLAWSAELNFWHEFMARSSTSFDTVDGSIPFYSDMKGNWGEFKLGLTSRISSHVKVYGTVNYQNDVDGNRRSFGGNLGVWIDW